MKKIILAITLSSAIGFANAQEMLTKKGNPILPEAKDWSIGFDAKPVFDYIGNMFNNSVNDSLYAGFQHPFILTGKYMIDANTAYRAMVRIGYSLHTDNAFMEDENSQVTPRALITDTRSTSETNVMLGLGKQKYRGKGRLKGYYGYEADLSFGGSKQTFDYGNQLNATNADPALISKDFGSILSDTLSNIQGQSRIVQDKLGSTFGIGVRGYLGIEYFFAAKFSIGAEYGWGISLQTQGEGVKTSEAFDGTSSAVVTTTVKTGKSSQFGFDNDNMGGAIFLSAYF